MVFHRDEYLKRSKVYEENKKFEFSYDDYKETIKYLMNEGIECKKYNYTLDKIAGYKPDYL